MRLGVTSVMDWSDLLQAFSIPLASGRKLALPQIISSQIIIHLFQVLCCHSSFRQLFSLKNYPSVHSFFFRDADRMKQENSVDKFLRKQD